MLAFTIPLMVTTNEANLFSPGSVSNEVYINEFKKNPMVFQKFHDRRSESHALKIITSFYSQ